MKKRSRVWRREGGAGWQGTGSVDDNDGVLCAEGKGLLVGVVGVSVREEDVIRACVGAGWGEKGMQGGLVSLGTGGVSVMAVPAKIRRLGGRSDAGSVANGSGRRK